MVAVTGLMTTDTLRFHFTIVFHLAFGAVFLAARIYLLLKQNHYSIARFREKSFVGNYVSDSLHLTLAIIIYSHCSHETNSEVCSINET